MEAGITGGSPVFPVSPLARDTSPWGSLVQTVSPRSVKDASPRLEPTQRVGRRLCPSESDALANAVFFKMLSVILF